MYTVSSERVVIIPNISVSLNIKMRLCQLIMWAYPGSAPDKWNNLAGVSPLEGSLVEGDGQSRELVAFVYTDGSFVVIPKFLCSL